MKKLTSGQKVTLTVGLVTAIVGLISAIAVIVAAFIQRSHEIEAKQMEISASQTAEARLTMLVPTFTPTSTNTPSPTPTLTPTLSPIQIAEAKVPTDFVLYDTFDTDTGKWKITQDSPQCNHVLENGTWKFECFGSATERVTFTILPSDETAKVSGGVEMAFYTLPVLQGKNQWGKYQILLRFGNDCGNPQRDYVISIRPNELQFIEADSKGESINPPSPKMAIGTLEPHIIRIEAKDGFVHYYLDGAEIRSVATLANSSPACWMFQSQDNNKFDESGYRGTTILWIAIKP